MEDEKFVELVRISDPVEADLFAAFLEDDGLEFQMRRSARTMAPAMPTSETATKFMVYSVNLPRAKVLLEEYRKGQATGVPPTE